MGGSVSRSATAALSSLRRRRWLRRRLSTWTVARSMARRLWSLCANHLAPVAPVTSSIMMNENAHARPDAAADQWPHHLTQIKPGQKQSEDDFLEMIVVKNVHHH